MIADILTCIILPSLFILSWGILLNLRRHQREMLVKAAGIALERGRLASRFTRLAVEVRDAVKTSDTCLVGVQLIGTIETGVSFPVWSSGMVQRGTRSLFTLRSPVDMCAGAILVPIGACRIVYAQCHHIACGMGEGGTMFGVVQRPIRAGEHVEVRVEVDE